MDEDGKCGKLQCIKCNTMFNSMGSEYCPQCEVAYEPEKDEAENRLNEMVNFIDSNSDNKGTVVAMKHLKSLVDEWLHRVEG